MQVIELTAGTYWLDIPEADLRILCGCPADSVKHLIKRGLIRRVERDGVAFETGPNAVLLSDVALQGGAFCNLAEFPVLQMLYRQGMILPGHPNNSGAKPLLIGLPEQVTAQMEYIHRGNYGLQDEEEMIAAGVPLETARQWMDVKLRFAFGSIRRPEDLLDWVTVEDSEVPIRGGVTVRRVDVNVFEFRHGGQRAIVDLNLEPGTRYAAPFTLGYHNLRREYFAVVHAGEGDGWDADRPTMSSVLMYQGKIYLIDAGPNLSTVLGALGIGVHEVEGVFHTHSHDDHFAGLTTLVRADHRVKYFATPAVRASVTKKLAALMGMAEGAFSDYFDVHDLAWDAWNDIDGLEVKPLYSPHPVETSVFVFRTLWRDGWRSYAHYADIASFRVLDQMTTPAQGLPVMDHALAAKVRADYLEPADIKKLDIGGGMIHGAAEDFADDRSGKLILAHTARPLTLAQREIGSGAPFGTVDVLIPAEQEYPLRFAHEYLSRYLVDCPQHLVRMLLNHPVETVNPETILIREGRPCDTVYLVLSGTVEAIGGDRDVGARMTAGAMLGELAALEEAVSPDTIRALGFVRVLRIPAALYREVVARAGLLRRIHRLAEARQFFNRTWLLDENVSGLVRNRIAAQAVEVRFEAGEAVPLSGRDHLLLVRHGMIEKILDGRVADTIGPGGHVGVSEILRPGQALFTYRAAEATAALAVPGDLLMAIPVTRLKLLESYRRRMAEVFIPRSAGPAFPWLADYSVGIPSMDRQHERLFDLTCATADHLKTGSREQLLDSLDILIEATRQHFQDEEALLERAGYPDVARHSLQHEALLEEIVHLRQRCAAGRPLDAGSFHRFFRDWLASHVAGEDAGYASFMAEQELYTL